MTERDLEETAGGIKVVRQLVDVAAGIKAQAEIGRAKIVKTEVR